MRMLKGIKAGSDVSIRVLTNLYGIPAKVYFPLKANNEQHGFYDDDIEYSDEPDFEGKLLIPTIFKIDEVTLPGVFDNLTQEEPVLYLPNEHKFPKYSLIVINPKTGTLKYRINNEEEYKDDESTIFRKYILVPVVSTVKDDIETIIDSQDEYEELPYSNLNYNEEISITDDIEPDPSIKYNPLKLEE